MATIASQSMTSSGLEAVFVAAAGGGDKFTPSDRTFIRVKNGDASDKTVTVVTQATHRGRAIADDVVVVTAGEERDIGPLPHELYAAAADGLGVITYSAVTSVTVAVVVLSS